jgi:uncharacterized membrane protein
LLDPPAAPAARADSAAGARPDTVAARQPVAAPVAPAARVAGPDTAVEATSAPAASADSGALAARDTFAAASPGLTVLGAEAPTLSMAERFRLDPAGNTIAVVVLLGMLAALAAVLVAWARRSAWPEVADWLIPVLALAGAGIAAYLAFVEVTGARAVCGPVGDCNTVQQSAYARIAGVLPVGVAGLVGYLLVLGAWAVAVAGPLKLRAQAGLVLWASALLGTVYSAYLTFLEPFVIGATCAWCISSALVMTALLLLSTPRAVASRDTAWRA